jgi:hypothetical protein
MKKEVMMKAHGIGMPYVMDRSVLKLLLLLYFWWLGWIGFLTVNLLEVFLLVRLSLDIVDKECWKRMGLESYRVLFLKAHGSSVSESVAASGSGGWDGSAEYAASTCFLVDDLLLLLLDCFLLMNW